VTKFTIDFINNAQNRFRIFYFLLFFLLCLQTNKDDNHSIQFCNKIANISVQNMITIGKESS